MKKPKEQAVFLLKKAGKTVALAESCTGGLLAASVTDVPGASTVFECGVVTYSAQMKESLLNIDPILIPTYGVVSRETAAAMACGVRRRGSADYGIGITGVAGPGPDGAHPEGDMYVAVANGTHIVVRHLQTGTKNQREANRHAAVDAALQLLIAEVTHG
jgi:PncC family amidohydrolase